MDGTGMMGREQGVKENQLQASVSQEGAAVYCFSLLCAGYVIPSNRLKAELCALLNTPCEKESPTDTLSTQSTHTKYFPHLKQNI